MRTALTVIGFGLILAGSAFFASIFVFPTDSVRVLVGNLLLGVGLFTMGCCVIAQKGNL